MAVLLGDCGMAPCGGGAAAALVGAPSQTAGAGGAMFGSAGGLNAPAFTLGWAEDWSRAFGVSALQDTVEWGGDNCVFTAGFCSWGVAV